MSEQTTKVVTGRVRFSYLHAFVPASINDSEDKKYSVSLIIPKSDTATLSRIERAIQAAKESGKSGKWGGKIPAKLKTPLRDGDEERPDDAAYANSFFMNANSTKKPGVVDKELQHIIDPDELYSGCYGKASVTFFAYDAKGSKGVACGLNNLQKLTEGEPLGGGGSSAESDFAPIEGEDDSFLD